MENNVSYVDKWAIACSVGPTCILLRADTVGISDFAFYYGFGSIIMIPNSVKFVGVSACNGLIYYNGTPDDWSNISISIQEGFYDYLSTAPRYYFSETEPTDTTYQYWHYDENGVPTVW